MADFNAYDSWTVQSPWSYGEDVSLDDVVARVEADPEAGALPNVPEVAPPVLPSDDQPVQEDWAADPAPEPEPVAEAPAEPEPTPEPEAAPAPAEATTEASADATVEAAPADAPAPAAE